ncbi:hypothetical protein Goari_015636 [Gossypium aridum]|uniref:Glycosyltransferase 2-like domain-containing protein n=1 Tax=Gossypium aridum TaxID=34290 RepID=A0A7J8WHC3_GOSAI|nr:hypothetical protein [Gossypium aridum]
MAPSLDFSNWWPKDARKGTPVVVKMENPNYSVVEIDGPDAAFRPVEKSRGKNAKQVTWVLLLKAHRAVGCLAWIASLFWALLGTIKKRLIFRQDVAMASEKLGKGKLLFTVIKAFLVTSLTILAFEVVAYLKGWHYFRNPSLHIPRSTDIQGLLHLVYVTWLSVRADYIAPPIQALSKFCVALFLIQSVDRMILSLGCFWIKYKKIKPRIEGDPFKSDDVEGSAYEYPMVLVQIPMCNEREVYEQSISAVCQLDWPKDRLLVQVLDDSDDESIQYLIKAEVAKWNQKGVNIIYRHRLVRTGYKAGNLKSAMSCEYVQAYEFVAIFDADFQPNPDFLKQTVPHFKIAIWKKANLILLFFLLRKLILPFYSFTLFCIILPLTMFVPEAELPVWVICYVPVFMSFLNILPSPKSFPFIVPYLLFENTMSVTKFNAMVSGLFQLGSSYEWVVTKKAGRSSESDLLASAEMESKIMNQLQIQRGASESELTELNRMKEQKEAAPVPVKRVNKIYRKELTLAFLLLTASVRSLLSAQGVHFYFLLFQGVTFLLVGLDLIGEQMS